jgi:pimeloyl-ACP methyl ester carboxylesterase
MNSIEAPSASSALPAAIRPWRRTAPRTDRWRRMLAGYALGWPWFDGFSAWALRTLYFPVSRLWAAAQLADGSSQRFVQSLRLPPALADSRRLRSALDRFERARIRARAAEAEWQRVFFGPDDSSVAHRLAVEAERREASHNFNATRRYFAFLLLRYSPPVRLDIDTPEEVARFYGEPELPPSAHSRESGNPGQLAHALPPLGPRFRGDERSVSAESKTVVEVSRTIPGAVGTDYWLRFPSPSARLGDTVYARVHEPAGATDPPTLILGHGICVEFDHWRGLIDEADTLCAAGFRVIRPEAPWHGRRTQAGYFGGERVVSVFPSGLLDTFAGAAMEWSVLADWSRRTSRGPLAFGGTSLGAQIAQFAAARAADGPERLRPDGLYLVTHCGHMTEATLRGDMGRIFGSVPAETKGWSPERMETCLARLDPGSRPPVAPARIVTVLGRRDSVTPFASALPLIDSWGVPPENRFIWDRAHFSMPMTLMRDTRPVARFREVMINAPNHAGARAPEDGRV